MILKRPRVRQHGDINPDPLATAQLQQAIIWKTYGLVPLFCYNVHASAVVVLQFRRFSSVRLEESSVHVLAAATAVVTRKADSNVSNIVRSQRIALISFLCRFLSWAYS